MTITAPRDGDKCGGGENGIPSGPGSASGSAIGLESPNSSWNPVREMVRGMVVQDDEHTEGGEQRPRQEEEPDIAAELSHAPMVLKCVRGLVRGMIVRAAKDQDADDVAEKLMRGLSQQALVDVLVDSIEENKVHAVLGAGRQEHVELELFSAVEPGSPFVDGGRVELAFECGDIIVRVEQNSSVCMLQ